MGTSITLDGQTLTDTDDYGCDWYTFAPVTGWSGSPASTINLTQKPRGQGGYLNVGLYMAPRVIALNGVVAAPDVDSLIVARDRLHGAAAVDHPVELSVTEGSLTRYCMVYRQDVVLSESADSTDTIAAWSVQLVAPDPRKFADDLSTSTGLPGGTGGLTAPFSAPFTVNSTITSGSCSLTNPGNANGPVKLRIDGPITGPQVTHVGSGLALTFASSLVLRSGEWIDVDMEAQTVLANGTASRAGWVTQRGWSSFEPGANLWALTAVSGSGLLTVTATPAWN